MTELRNNRPETEHKYVRPTTDQLNQIYNPSETESKTAEKKGKKKLIIAAIAGTGIAVSAALAAFAPNVFAGDKEDAPVAEPVSTSEVVDGGETVTDPAAPETEVSLEQQIEALSIPAGLDDDTVAQRYAELSTAWWNAGKSDTFVMDLVEAQLETGISDDAYYAQAATENAQLYAPAIYGPNWQNDPAIVALVEKKIESNIANLKAYNSTNGTDYAEDIEAYKAWVEVTNVRLISGEESSRMLEVSYIEDDNSEMNRAPDGAVSGGSVMTLEFTEVNGKAYVTQNY